MQIYFCNFLLTKRRVEKEDQWFYNRNLDKQWLSQELKFLFMVMIHNGAQSCRQVINVDESVNRSSMMTTPLDRLSIATSLVDRSSIVRSPLDRLLWCLQWEFFHKSSIIGTLCFYWVQLFLRHHSLLYELHHRIWVLTIYL